MINSTTHKKRNRHTRKIRISRWGTWCFFFKFRWFTSEIKDHSILTRFRKAYDRRCTTEKHRFQIFYERGRIIQCNTSVRYSDDGFSDCCCFCCTLEGIYNESNAQQITFTVNGDVLVKQVIQQPGPRYCMNHYTTRFELTESRSTYMRQITLCIVFNWSL